MSDTAYSGGLFARAARLTEAGEDPAPSDLTDLYQRYRQELSAYVKKRFGPGPPDPEDVVQSAFASYAALDERDKIDNPRAYLYRCAHNIAVRGFRRQATLASYENDLRHGSEDDQRETIDAERILIAKERYRVLDAVVRDMPEKRRSVFLLSRVHHLSCAEIARRTRWSESYVKKLLAEALADCAQALADL